MSKKIQNQSGQPMGAASSKDHRFHAFFGCGVEVAIILVNLLNEFTFPPHKTQIMHLLWALHFMKCYPTEQPACAAAGGSKGAINPNTICKYIWPVIEAMTKMEPMGVCKCLVFVHSSNLILTLNILFQIKFENRYKHNGNYDCLLSIDGTDFLIPEHGCR